MQDLQRVERAGTERGAGLEIGWRALLTMFAIVNIANSLLSPFGGPRGFRPEGVVISFLGAYTWAALTPVVLWITSRLSLESGDRTRRAVGLLIVAFVFAGVVSAVLALVGSAAVDPPAGGQAICSGARP